jgi:hypothetical protein
MREKLNYNKSKSIGENGERCMNGSEQNTINHIAEFAKMNREYREVNNSPEVGRRGSNQDIERRIMQNEAGYLKHVNVMRQEKKHEKKNQEVTGEPWPP